MVAVVAPDGRTDKISLEHIPMTPYDKRIIVGAMIVFTVVGIVLTKAIKMGDTLRLVGLIIAVTITEALANICYKSTTDTIKWRKMFSL